MPADVIRVSDQILSLAEELEPIGNRNVITMSPRRRTPPERGHHGRVNVEINLGGIADPDIVADLRGSVAAVDDLAVRADKVTAAVRGALGR